MLGFVFIFIIGKYFYKLAEEYNQNKWLFAILGIIVYYAAGAIGGIIIGVLSVVFNFEVDWDNSILMAAIGLPIGLASCWLFYYLLEKKWKKIEIKPIQDINNIGKE